MGVQDDIRRFENEVFLADPLTGFGSRHNLIERFSADPPDHLLELRPAEGA